MTKKLTEPEFKRTFGEKMIDMTYAEIDPIDIWSYVEELNGEILNKNVDYVYRNDQGTFDHVLLPTTEKNTNLVIVVDLQARMVFGHYHLDLNKEYGSK